MHQFLLFVVTFKALPQDILNTTEKTIKKMNSTSEFEVNSKLNNKKKYIKVLNTVSQASAQHILHASDLCSFG